MNRIVCLIQASQGTPFSNKFFKISFHRIDSCLILRSLTFNWIDVGNIVFKVFCKSGLRSDESRRRIIDFFLSLLVKIRKILEYKSFVS